MGQSIRLVIVGSGGMAKSRARVFSGLEGCTVVGVVARNPETGGELAGELRAELLGDWRQAVREDVDAVAVCTNNDSHCAIATAAIEAGKHVFLEYPLSRCLADAEQLVATADSASSVLRVAHDEVRSAGFRALRGAVANLGELQLALLNRLTPGRGSRPNTLFNLAVSGPPALFFIYQVHPIVVLFGPAAWVEGHGQYTELAESGQYRSFVNTMTAGFERGGCAIWSWAGGIAVDEAEEYQRIVMSGGTLARREGEWVVLTSEGVEDVSAQSAEGESMEALFIREINEESENWRRDLHTSFDALRISLGAERAFAEGRRILL